MATIIPRGVKLYALLVGINEYEEKILFGENEVRFPKLQSCVSDANGIRDYLLNDSAFVPYIEMLTGKAATRQAIVRLFTEHLGKANKDDSVLFYFSGHGTQEEADKFIFSSETDGKLEDIACYYDLESKDNFLLCDKELRWLIQKISLKTPHIVTIFDCCHSGDNTRNAPVIKKAFDKVVEKRVSFVFPKRSWDQFIFSDHFTENMLLREGEEKLLPEGKHFQLSACESDESAIEISGESVFTKTLLKVLNNAGGDITYKSLGDRTRQYMRNVYLQKPKVYVADAAPNDFFKCFLNRPVNEDVHAFGEVLYNVRNGWQLSLGAIHGVGKNTPVLSIFDPKGAKKYYAATIKSVNVDTAALLVEGCPDEGIVYRANMEGLTSEALRVYFAMPGGDLNEHAVILNSLFDKAKKYIAATDDEEQSQYVVRYLEGRYYITHPNDPFRPLVKPILSHDPEAASKLMFDLNQISNWEFLKNLSNSDKGNSFSEKVLKVEIRTGDDGSFKNVEDDESIDIGFVSKGGKWTNSITTRITNISGKNLYCCALYLVSNFASYSRYLNPPVKMLGVGESVELQHKGNCVIPLSADEAMIWYNRQELKDYIKFIISASNFDATLLDFKQLKSPDYPAGARRVEGSPSGSANSLRYAEGWVTKHVTLVFKNPVYNNLSREAVNAMMANPSTVDLAKGLYFSSTNKHPNGNTG